MAGAFRFSNAVYWLGLLVWTSALISAAVAAMNVFPVLGDAAVRLDDYAAYPAEEHGMLLAGQIMERVFFVVDMLQFVAIPITVLALVSQLTFFRMRVRAAANAVRTLCIVAAAALFAWHAVMLAPDMNRELRLRWAAARAGDVAEARAHQEVFEADHPTADLILKVDLVLVLVAVVASSIAMPPSPRMKPELETPRLLSRS